MRTADIITASVLMALGGLVIADAVRLGFRWSSDGPESGFFPFWLAVILVLTSVMTIARAVGSESEKRFATRAQMVLVLKVLVPAVTMVVLTQFVGLYVASALYLGVYMRWVGRHSWPATVALATCVPLVTFLIFEKWFLVPLPKGPLEAWLGY